MGSRRDADSRDSGGDGGDDSGDDDAGLTALCSSFHTVCWLLNTAERRPAGIKNKPRMDGGGGGESVGGGGGGSQPARWCAF